MSTRKVLAALMFAVTSTVVVAAPAEAVYVSDGQTVLIGGTRVAGADPTVSGYDDFEWSGPRRLR